MPTPRSVLITGCSTGIGEAVAHGLVARDHHVIASARREEDVARLQRDGLEAIQLDLDHSDSIERAVNDTLSRTGGQLYALFNNGAYGQPGAVEDLSREALRQQLETNVLGWLELTNLLLPHMRRAGEGRIIQNSSILGFAPMPFRGAYNASKFALEGLSDTLRLELTGSNIHVSLIQPGPIRSQFRANSMNAFYQYINVEKSPHRDAYSEQVERLRKAGQTSRFTLGPEAVLKRVIHALESRHPKSRYPVTTPTYVFAVLKRLLPQSVLDQLLIKAGA